MLDIFPDRNSDYPGNRIIIIIIIIIIPGTTMAGYQIPLWLYTGYRYGWIPDIAMAAYRIASWIFGVFIDFLRHIF